MGLRFRLPSIIEAKSELKRLRPFSIFSYLSSLNDAPGAIGYLLRDQNQFRDICQFLAIEPYDHSPEPTLVKIRKGGHRDVISNYDEVKDALVNSHFNGMLA